MSFLARVRPGESMLGQDCRGVELTRRYSDSVAQFASSVQVRGSASEAANALKIKRIACIVLSLTFIDRFNFHFFSICISSQVSIA